jgi:hypothetical protein
MMQAIAVKGNSPRDPTTNGGSTHTSVILSGVEGSLCETLKVTSTGSLDCRSG